MTRIPPKATTVAPRTSGQPRNCGTREKAKHVNRRKGMKHSTQPVKQGLILGVKTCDVFLCCATVVVLLLIVVRSLTPLLYFSDKLHSFFFTEDNPTREGNLDTDTDNF